MKSSGKHLLWTDQAWSVRFGITEPTLRGLPTLGICLIFEELLKPLTEKTIVNKSNCSNTSS